MTGVQTCALPICIMLLSVVALALIIENVVSLKRDKLAPPELIDEVDRKSVV